MKDRPPERLRKTRRRRSATTARTAAPAPRRRAGGRPEAATERAATVATPAAPASIVVCEHDPPYRGIEVRGRAVLHPADIDVVRDIAVRYLGTEKGRAYADRGYDDTVIRIEPGRLRAWDFADDLN